MPSFSENLIIGIILALYCLGKGFPTMKQILLTFIILITTGFYSVKADTLPTQADLVVEIASHFKSGNSKELSKYFASSVTLSLLNNENVYSSAQTEIILTSFFRSNPPQKVKIIHLLDNNSNYQHAVLLLNTSNQDYRVAFSLKGSDKHLQLIEIRIEEIN